MDVADLVRAHYGGDDLESAILSGLASAGVDTEHLSVADLAAVDQLHAGFSSATRYLQEQLALGPSTRLLDVGCGIGGPARMAAASYGCSVLGVDLSPTFIRTAAALTARVGLAHLVDFRVSSGDHLDEADGAFDRAMMVHVGMNIADKEAVFAEVRRVLRPGGVFAVYEQMLTGEGPLTYPLPWAEDERSSFLTSPDAYANALRAAGFVIDRTEDLSRGGGAGEPPRPGLSPAAVFGSAFRERVANNMSATRAGTLAAILVTAHRE